MSIESKPVSTVFRHMTGNESKGAGKPQASEISGTGKKARAARLCYVDDSRTSAYVVKRMLKPYGYEVDHFSSAEPALIAIIESDYDLLLTDLKVSPTGMDGDDLVRALRASGHSKVSSMPVIVITGATDTEILSQVYDAGANQIMTKPVSGEELDAHIRKLVFANRQKTDDDEFAELAAEAAEQEKPGATVVPFGSEVKKSDSSEIPTLGVETDADDGSRRVLSNQGSSDTPLTTPDGRTIPRPSVMVRPAPRVKPTINQSGDARSSAAIPQSTPKPQIKPQPKPTLNAQAEAARKAKQLAALKMQAAARLAQQKATRTAAKSTVAAKASQAKSSASNAVDPEALAKVKAAAAAKRAKIIEQQRAKMIAQKQARAKQQQAQAKLQETHQHTVQDKLEPEIPLTLEPKENEPVDVFNRGPENTFGQRDAGGQRPRSQAAERKPQPQDRAPNEGINDPFSRQPESDPFADAAKAATQNFHTSSETAHTADLFGQNDSANILNQMDQYPLVQTDYKDNAGASGMVSAVSSIIELWGPKKVIFAVVLVAFLAFFYNQWSGMFSSGVSVETTLVEQGEIFQSITVPGKVVSKLRVDVTPSIAGRLTNVYVEEGDSVKKGELLARLDDREAKSNLKRAEANLHNAEEDVSLAERSLKRLRQAFSKGAVARQLVEESEVELRSARARLSVAEEEVRTAKLSLENPRIVAPFEGTITARYVEVGQWVVPSETLFSLVDQSQREIEVRVDAADSGGIAVGQTVTLSSDAFPGLEWPESVTRLAAATSNVGNANTVSVYVSLGSSAPSLRFGQQVDAEIRTSWNPSALKVPYGAIINRGGKTYVAVVQDNFVNLVEVETGIEDFTHVEIRQGVSVGQYIILANGADIDEGDRVVISTNN